MRGILVSLIVLAAASWAAVEIETPAVPPANSDTESAEWRRTVDGWEESQNWNLRPPAPLLADDVTRIHPGLVAIFISLSSVGALLWLDPRYQRPGR